MSIELSYFDEFYFVEISKNEFELKTSLNSDLDEFFTFNRYWDVKELADEIGLGEVFDKIIPYVRSLPLFTDKIEKEEFEKIMVSPKECLRINQETQLISKLLEKNSDFDVYLNSVLNNWEKGRFVVVHYE